MERVNVNGSEITVHEEKDIVEREGRLYLSYTLANFNFELPLVYIPSGETPEKDVAIAWLDPNPGRNRSVSEAAAKAMTHLLVNTKTQIILMTSSSKSEPFIKKAARQAAVQRIIYLPSDRNKQKIAQQSQHGEVMSYTPVTGIQKYMTWPKGVMPIEMLLQQFPNGEGITIVDDIYTTGQTVRTMKDTAHLLDSNEHKIAVIGVEQPFATRGYPVPIDPRIHTASIFPEFISLKEWGIDPKMLHPISQRETIPQARFIR